MDAMAREREALRVGSEERSKRQAGRLEPRRGSSRRCTAKRAWGGEAERPAGGGGGGGARNAGVAGEDGADGRAGYGGGAPVTAAVRRCQCGRRRRVGGCFGRERRWLKP